MVSATTTKPHLYGYSSNLGIQQRKGQGQKPETERPKREVIIETSVGCICRAIIMSIDECVYIHWSGKLF